MVRTRILRHQFLDHVGYDVLVPAVALTGRNAALFVLQRQSERGVLQAAVGKKGQKLTEEIRPMNTEPTREEVEALAATLWAIAADYGNMSMEMAEEVAKREFSTIQSDVSGGLLRRIEELEEQLRAKL